MAGYDYTGYESAFVPTSPSSPEIDRKTTKPADAVDNKPKEVADFKKTNEITLGSNILNGFRSVTYNFTLAGLPTNYLENPEAYRTGELDLIILKSGGKGNSSVKITNQFKTGSIAPTTVSSGGGRGSEDFAKRDPRRLDLSEDEKRQPGKNYGEEFLNDFNKFSPGRFDMFIENVEIETLMTFTENSNSTLPTKVKFDVIEPYSVNGFIESLHATAVSAGYTSYINASYLLKIEFWGYPDNDLTEFKSPVKIPNSERFFPIGFTNLEVEITEKGTKYACSAVPYNERAFGQPSVLKKPIKMSGVTVKQILDNFIKEFNDQIKQSNKDANAQSKNNDSYEIVFKERKDGKWQDAPEHEIAKSKLLELYEDNVLYKFANPSEVKSAYQPGQKPKTLNPSSAVVNFQENTSIHDVITAVIRDSKYVRDILSELAEATTAKKPMDRYGFIDYFLVRVETKNKTEIDPNTKRPYQTFTYIISPYKVHYTRIPTYGSVQIKEEELKLFAIREYNYIYTGNNIDILNFKLNFNTLFFEAIPASLGDKNTPNSKDSTKPANDSQPKIKGVPAEDQKENTTHASPPVLTVPSTVQAIGGTAVPYQNSPYSQMARQMHEAIINSQASMITGNIDILGDPFYLVTGGVGNYNPKEVSGKFGVVGQEEADHTKGEVNIAINFRNPIDINTFESGGMVYFDPNRVAFSGVYMVTKAVSSFKNGEFKQTLDIIRKPGQILKEEKNKKVIKPENLYKSVPNDSNQSVEDSKTYASSGQRASSSEVYDYFQRGYPSPGLPGDPDNFTNALGGLGGDNNSFNRLYGLTNRAGQLDSNVGIIGQSLPTDLTSNLRLNVAGLANINQSSLSSAALLNAATNILVGNASAKQVVGKIAGTIIGQEISKITSKYNIGSGIGEGKTVSIAPQNIIGSLTANDVKFGNTINEVSSPVGLVNNITGEVKKLGTNAIDAVNKLGSNASALINNVKDSAGTFLGSISDPNAAAAKLGIDAAKISGLSSNLESKLSSQISSIKENIPENLNLTNAVAAGVALNVIPLSKIQNLPPTAPFTTAESFRTIPDTGRITSEVMTNPLRGLGQNTNVVDSTILRDKTNTVRTQISKITNMTNIVDKGISGTVSAEFGSNSSKINPLEKLINRDQV
jgi:hypothetical protein